MNVWGRRGEWDQRRAALRRGLAAQSADLVALQEVVKTDRYDQMSDLLDTDFHFAHQAARERAQPPDVEEGQGVSIASRWPILAVEELDLKITPRTQDFAATALIARIDAPEPIGPVLFVNYLPSWKPAQGHERELQAVATLEVIERNLSDQDAHVVIAGDLDAEPDDASIRFWTGKQSLGQTSTCYVDAWADQHPDRSGPTRPGPTFTPDNPTVIGLRHPRRIDYILVGCRGNGEPTLDIRRCDRIFDQPVDGVWASDHFGLVVDVEPTIE